jgi:hypothetical protein
VRLRVAEQRGQSAYFETVRSRLSQEPAVRGVQVNARTGSVLLDLQQPVDWPGLLARAAQLGLFAVVMPPAGTAPPRSRPDLGPLGRLGRLAEPGSSGGTALAMALLAGAAIQGWRGQLAAPAVTLAWYALQLLRSGRTG